MQRINRYFISDSHCQVGIVKVVLVLTAVCSLQKIGRLFWVKGLEKGGGSCIEHNVGC